MTKSFGNGLVRGAPHWQRTAVVIATGPSLSDDQLERVRIAANHEKAWSVTVNNAFERMPLSHLAYFGDYLFGKVHMARMLASHKYRIVTGSGAAAERWKLHHVPVASRPGLGFGEVIHANGNSGMQALNLAAWLGAKRIVLIGFDMKPAADGRAHYFGQHPQPLTQTQLFEEWIHKAGAIARDAIVNGIEVLNCTPDSALTVFPRCRLEGGALSRTNDLGALVAGFYGSAIFGQAIVRPTMLSTLRSYECGWDDPRGMANAGARPDKLVERAPLRSCCNCGAPGEPTRCSYCGTPTP